MWAKVDSLFVLFYCLFDFHGDLFFQLEKHDKEVAEGRWRTEEAMSAEASVLRKLF